MSIELLLIRHGKAEDSSSTKDDAKRQLTDKGKEELTVFMSSVNRELTTDKGVKVWTSPLKRARQTASIVSDQLNWPEAEKKDFIAAGDLSALMDEVADLDSETRVVVVGHKPTLGIWVKELTGSDYSFKKGGIALVRLSDDDRTKGSLIWDKHPKSKKKSEKETYILKNTLLKQADRMRRTYKDFQHNPYSPKRVHRFRVEMRKMRSLLQFVKHLIGAETYDYLNDLIKDGTHRIEPIREADVLIASCGERALEEPELIDGYPDVFKYLHNERRKWMRTRLTDSMISAFKAMLDETEQGIRDLRFYEEKTSHGNWDAYLQSRFTKKKKKVLKSFKEADHSDHKSAHEIRKQAKKLRYTAKGYKDLLPSKDVKKVKKKAEAIQDELGLICDIHTNSELLTAYAEKAKDPELKKALSTLAERQRILREDVIASHSELNNS